MPTFCRHNRFVERCPICSKTLGDHAPADGKGRRQTPTAGRHRRLRTGGDEVRVRREDRAQDDGYRSVLAPGLHAYSDAVRLAEEIAFASGRLLRLQTAPPDLFAEIRALADSGNLERATWMCFLVVYLSPLQGDEPFAGIRLVLDDRDPIPSLDGIPLGPRTSHDPARGDETLRAYRHWAEHAGGAGDGDEAQTRAFIGEELWTPQRRFDRVFERLALPGFGRMGRYELLVTLGHIGLYKLQADTLHLVVGGAAASSDLTTIAAKRIFGIADPLYLKRRALAFAEAISVPIDVLDLAFANWSAGERATLGFEPEETVDPHALKRARDALEL